MIAGISSNNLSTIYRQQTMDYTRVLEQIATGRRFTRPSDDFTGFMRMRAAEASVREFSGINENLVQARETSVAASTLGNQIYDGLLELRELANLYADTTDDEEQARLTAEFTAQRSVLQNLLTANIGGTGATDTNVSGVSVDVGGGNNLAYTPGTIEGIGTITITGDGENDGIAGINTAIGQTVTFTATADAFTSAIDRQMTINQNIVSARENTAAAIGSIDEVSAINRATALAVRQQATVSMAAQANISQLNLARLFT
jgi:flagellin-like hook-associated protein FlgL